MSDRFHTTLQIAATPARVWAELVRTDRWPSWDPALERVEGTLESGGKVRFHVVQSKRAFASKVVGWEPERRMVLRGGMPLGLFAGTRTYDLTALDGGTRFRMGEAYTGPLAGLVVRSIPDMQPSFDAFAAGLRQAAEA